MIIDKEPLPDDPTPTEAPPSYDTLGSSSASTSYSLEKTIHPTIDEHTEPGPSNSGRVIQPSTSTNVSATNTPFFTADRKGKGKAPALPNAWRPFNTLSTSSSHARTARELRETVLRLVRDLVEAHPAPNAAAPGILASCAAACAGLPTPLDFGKLIQERTIEGKSPLYWAAVKRKEAGGKTGSATSREGVGTQTSVDDENEGEEELLAMLLSYAIPLDPSTASELRAACLATGDDALFQRLRSNPGAGLSQISGATQMLLGVSVTPDTVTVQEGPQDRIGAFMVWLVMPAFRKRMTVAGGVEVEWIARGRMWSLSFFPAPEPPLGSQNAPAAGTWCIRLALVEASPPTHVDGLLTIASDLQPVPTAMPLSSSDVKSPTLLGLRLPVSASTTTSMRKEKDGSEERRPLRIRLQAHEPLQAPHTSAWTQWIGSALGSSPTGAGSGPASAWSKSVVSAQRGSTTIWRVASGGGENGIIYPLMTSSTGAGLQYADSAYIAADGALRARLEVRLEKPKDGDCVIC